MKDFEFRRKLREMTQVVKKEIPTVLRVQGLNFIKRNFQQQGFDDGGLRRWKPRKTVDSQGRDITRYRTSRVGKRGTLNRYGRRIGKRAILTGHNSGGNKLRNSFKARIERNKVVLYTYKPYAERHNEGLDGMPERRFIGNSRTLKHNIEQEVERLFRKVFKK